MATRKKAAVIQDQAPEDDVQGHKSKNPLVFISHDTRDAELAEEFSELLTNASAGALESFRSSDKKGTQGIEYGLDWYPAIMDKIDEASDVVCLLTRRSVERPWILYEAGVAKGKLGKKVIGVAMGINHSVAFTGPFAQFQNNDGSVDAITKLVLELVSKIPALRPKQSHVEQLVKTFHKTATEIVKKYPEETESTTADTNDNVVAKLFEEVKIMFESLPSRIENRSDSYNRNKKLRPNRMMVEDLLNIPNDIAEVSIGILLAATLLRDDMPWLYELALESYRVIQTGNPADIRREANRMHKVMDVVFGRSYTEHIGLNTQELRSLAETFLYFTEQALKRAAAKKENRTKEQLRNAEAPDEE